MSESWTLVRPGFIGHNYFSAYRLLLPSGCIVPCQYGLVLSSYAWYTKSGESNLSLLVAILAQCVPPVKPFVTLISKGKLIPKALPKRTLVFSSHGWLPQGGLIAHQPSYYSAHPTRFRLRCQAFVSSSSARALGLALPEYTSLGR